MKKRSKILLNWIFAYIQRWTNLAGFLYIFLSVNIIENLNICSRNFIN